MLRGWDAYDGQGIIDFEQALAAGWSFCIAKATERTGNVQDTFAPNRASAAATPGFGPFGAYCFGRPEDGLAAAEAQAGHFCDVVGKLGHDESVWLDLETGNPGSWPAFSDLWWPVIEDRLGDGTAGSVPGGTYMSDDPSSRIPALAGFANGEEERGPGHAMRGRMMTRLFARVPSLLGSSISRRPLWDAGYGINNGSPPPWGKGFEAKWAGQPFEHSWATGPWDTWTIWQFSSTGRVPGIGGGNVNVDVNLAPDDLRARLGLGGTPDPHPPIQENVMSFTTTQVYPGEQATFALPQIGNRFGVTMVSVTLTAGPEPVTCRAVVGPDWHGLDPDHPEDLVIPPEGRVWTDLTPESNVLQVTNKNAGGAQPLGVTIEAK